MALVPCPECQKEVSTKAVACPQCAFPFPGKPVPLGSTKQVPNLHTCQECGLHIPKEGQVCPNCGVNKSEEQMPPQNEQAPLKTNGDLTEETWLCPHCGIPYTRKVKKQKLATVSLPQEAPPQEALLPKETPSVLPEEDEFKNLVMEFEQEKKPSEMGGLLPLRSRSPLWEEPATGKEEVESLIPHDPKKKKVFIVLVTLGLVFGVIAGILFALWQVKGLTPIDLLSHLQF